MSWTIGLQKVQRLNRGKIRLRGNYLRTFMAIHEGKIQTSGARTLLAFNFLMACVLLSYNLFPVLVCYLWCILDDAPDWVL